MIAANGQTVVPPSAGGSGSLTQDLWVAFMLAQINAQGGNVPITLNNVQNVERWMTAEEPTSNWFDRNNPLNASLGTSAADGTGSYANLNQGAQYTARMILQQNMNGIYTALANNASPDQFSAAVVSSPWASSHYGVAAAGAPAQYVEAGRGFDYIANIPVPPLISAGDISKVLPLSPELGVLPASPTPIPGLPNQGVNVGAGVLSGLSGLETGVDTILTNITSPSWWLRVGMGALGVVLFGIGLAGFISTTKPGSTSKSDTSGAVSGAAKDAAAAAIVA